MTGRQMHRMPLCSGAAPQCAPGGWGQGVCAESIVRVSATGWWVGYTHRPPTTTTAARTIRSTLCWAEQAPVLLQLHTPDNAQTTQLPLLAADPLASPGSTTSHVNTPETPLV
jgi:hypothetical protein